MLAVAVAAPLVLGSAGNAAAHGRSVSYSSWELNGDSARVRARVSRLELTRLAPLGLRSTTGPQVGAYLRDRLVLAADGRACTSSREPEPRRAPEGWVAFEWTLDCPAAEGRVLESRVLLDVAPSHLHLVRWSEESGALRERVLTRATPRWAVDATAGPGPAADHGVRWYVGLGIEHILSGWDHLAFVAALLLLARSAGEVARLITGFTVGHSATLGLAAAGFVDPSEAAVEAAIAFSVALLAAENAWELSGRDRRIPLAVLAGLALLATAAAAGVGPIAPLGAIGLALFAACHFGLLARTRRVALWRGALALAFGLVHGFGFAGVLGELELPAERLLPALFGFNVGVEIGQLAAVALAWPVLWWAERHSRGLRDGIAAWGSGAVAGLGVFWLVVRVTG